MKEPFGILKKGWKMNRVVIHIQGRNDDRMTRELDSMYPNDWKVFDAIQLTPAKKGIAESFKQVIRENYKSDMVQVFEDDLLFTTSKARTIFEENFHRLPSDWDIYLAGSYISEHQKSQAIKLSGLLKLKEFSSLHNVIFRNTCYDKILDYRFEDSKLNIDTYLSGCGLNVYVCDPQVCIQYNGYSYNQGKSIDLSHYYKNMNIKFDENTR
jgi:tRNA(His) 5'-end guanylyltransferase